LWGGCKEAGVIRGFVSREVGGATPWGLVGGGIPEKKRPLVSALAETPLKE